MKRLVTHRFSYIVPAGKKRSTPDGPATAARRGASRLPRSADRSAAIPGSYACLEAVRCTEKALPEDAPEPRAQTVSAPGTRTGGPARVAVPDFLDALTSPGHRSSARVVMVVARKAADDR